MGHTNPHIAKKIMKVTIALKSSCSGVIFIQSAEAQLALSGGQLMFTSGLPMFALSLKCFLSLPWGPSTNIDFLFMSKISFEGHKKS